MTKISTKKTLNFHKFSVRIQELFLYWKFGLPVLFSIAGLIIGSGITKGEGWISNFFEKYIEEFLINTTGSDFKSDILIHLLFPSSFALVLFFCGLSVYGGMIANIIPFIYSSIIGIISYYFYSNYVLKGLAYCVIIVFPYAVLSLFSLILITVECINMSQVLSNNLNPKNKRMNDYSFTLYYKNCIKSYMFIILATILKTILNFLFIDIFAF